MTVAASKINRAWAKVLVPMAGMAEDAGPLSAAASVARVFEAELAAVFTPADITELAPWIGDGFVGGGAPVVVQSMTNTDTADVDATVAQVAALAQLGRMGPERQQRLLHRVLGRAVFAGQAPREAQQRAAVQRIEDGQRARVTRAEAVEQPQLGVLGVFILHVEIPNRV